MKKIAYILFFNLLMLAPLYAQAASAAAQHADKIVAIVNDDVITQSELQQRLAQVKHQIARSNMPEPKAAELRQQVLDDLINTSLQLQLAKRAKMQVSDAEVDATIANIAKGNKVSVEQMKQALTQEEGISFSAYRQQIKNQILLSKVGQQFLSKDVTVGDKEVMALMNNPPRMEAGAAEYHLIDVTIPLPEGASAAQTKDSKDIAAQVVNKLKPSADVTKLDLGKDVSGQEIQASDLGWRRANALPPLFANEVSKMQVGSVVGPLAAPNGLHVIKLVAVHGAAATKLTKEQAQDFIYRQKMEQKVIAWIKELRSMAYIKIME